MYSERRQSTLQATVLRRFPRLQPPATSVAVDFQQFFGLHSIFHSTPSSLPPCSSFHPLIRYRFPREEALRCAEPVLPLSFCLTGEDLSFILPLVMIHEKKPSQVTHYDILCVKEDASYEEIRISYRSALLDSHPDKLHSSSNVPGSSSEIGDGFARVQKAWEILSDSRSRAIYDRELESLRNDAVVADDVSLEDMEVEGQGDGLELYYQCRCGDYFSVSHLELEEMGYQLLVDGGKLSIKNIDAMSLPCSIILLCGSSKNLIQIIGVMGKSRQFWLKGIDASSSHQLSIPENVIWSLLTILGSSSLEEALENLIESSKTKVGRSNLAAKAILPMVLQLTQCLSQSSEIHLQLLSLRLIRNLCAGEPTNQDMFINHNGSETVLSVINSLKLGSDDSDYGIMRAGLQVLANVSLAGEKQQCDIWHHCFPDGFIKMAVVRRREIADPLSMIIYACCDGTLELFRELCEQDGLTIIAEIVRTASIGYFTPMLSLSLPPASFGEDWVKLLLSRLCLENSCFTALFSTLDPYGELEISGYTEKGDICFTSEQAFLLRVLSEILHERIQEIRVSKEFAICTCEIFRKAVRVVDFTTRGQSALPTGCAVIDILGYSLTILRDTCAQAPLIGADSNVEDQGDAVNALLSEGLLDMLLFLLGELEPPSQIRKTIKQDENQQAASQSTKICPYKGFRRDIVSVIGNCAYQRKHVQDEIREKNAIFLLLQQCVLDDDNSFLREWGMWTVRNLLEGNAENHGALADLELQGTVDTPELATLGLRVEVDPKTGNAKLVNV